MSADGKIYIYITDELLENRIKGTKEAAPENKTKTNQKELFNDYVKHEFFNFIKSEANQMANYTLGNIGNFTGDYNAQRQVNFIMSANNVISNIASSALVGAKIGGGYGALIGAGVAVASQVVNFGFNLYSQNLEIRKQNYSIGQLRQLSGLDTLTNGSRI